MVKKFFVRFSSKLLTYQDNLKRFRLVCTFEGNGLFHRQFAG